MLGIWFLCTFSEKNKEDHRFTTTSLLSRQKYDLFLKNIITGDKKWLFYDNAQYKKQCIDKDESLQTPPNAADRQRWISADSPKGSGPTGMNLCRLPERQRTDRDESLQPTWKSKLDGRKVMLCVWWDHYCIIDFDFQTPIRHSMQTYIFSSCNMCIRI